MTEPIIEGVHVPRNNIIILNQKILTLIAKDIIKRKYIKKHQEIMYIY